MHINLIQVVRSTQTTTVHVTATYHSVKRKNKLKQHRP